MIEARTGRNFEFWQSERTIRIQLNLTQREVANIFGTSQAEVSRSEMYGGKLPSREEVFNLAEEASLNNFKTELLVAYLGHNMSIEFFEDTFRSLQSIEDRSTKHGEFSLDSLEELVMLTLKHLKGTT